MSSNKTIATFDPSFQINEFFNNLPIRIVGSVECPMFYAEDIAKILGVKRHDVTIRNYDELEIITGTQRRIHNIVTYRDNGTKDNHRTLLTLGGAVKMVANTQNELSYGLRKWLYSIVESISKSSATSLRVINETLMREKNELVRENTILKKAQEKFIVSSEQVYVFEIRSDQYNIDDMGLHSDDEDSTDAMLRERFDECSTVDDVDAYNEAIKKYPALKVTDVLYKVTANPSPADLTEYHPIFKTYCANAIATLKEIKHELRRDVVDCTHGDIFECSLEKIKHAIGVNAIVLC